MSIKNILALVFVSTAIFSVSAFTIVNSTETDMTVELLEAPDGNKTDDKKYHFVIPAKFVKELTLTEKGAWLNVVFVAKKSIGGLTRTRTHTTSGRLDADESAWGIKLYEIPHEGKRDAFSDWKNFETKLVDPVELKRAIEELKAQDASRFKK